jgi:O-antigen ligase
MRVRAALPRHIPGASLALAGLIAPPLAVVAPLGLAPLFTLAALALLANDWRRAVASIGVHRGLFALFVLLSLWGAVTAEWSPIPGHSLLESARFLAISTGGIVLLGAAQSVPESEARPAGLFLLAGVALAIVLLHVERSSGGIVFREVHVLRAGSAMSMAVYDRSVTLLVMMIWPAVAFLVAQGQRLAAVLLMLAAIFTTEHFSSHAAMLALVVSLPMGVLAWLRPRVAAISLASVIPLVAFIFPLVAPGELGIEHIRRATPFLWNSGIHRLAIWHFVSDRIAERPLLGWGMDASRAIPGGQLEVGSLFPSVHIEGFAQALPLHPHDAALQWRLELGVPGALLAAVAAGVVLWRLAESRILPGWHRALAFGYATAGLVVGLLSFGAWQSWWLATLWLGAALLASIGESSRATAT